MLSALKISHKLALLVAVAILAFSISQGFSIVTERSNSERLAQVEERLSPTLERTTINLGQLALMEMQLKNSVTTGDKDLLQETRGYYDTIRGNLTDIARLNPALANEARDLGKLLDTYYNKASNLATGVIDGTADFSRIGDEAAANAQRLEQLRSDLDAMRKLTRSRFQGEISDTVQAASQAGAASLTIAIAALTVLVVLSVVIARSITGSLQRIIEPLRDMASGEGDLTARIDYHGRDELRELVEQFNRFVEKLHTSFATIRKDVGELNTVAELLATTSQVNLERISSQAQAISSTRNSVDELVRSVEEVAGFASSASDQTQDAAKFAQSGQTTVNANVDTIKQLVTDIEGTAQLVNQFDEFSSRVGGLLDTIQTVAEQTNLLALNAAIEAARAGEHGRGFAVVADEVRGLAVRTHKATEEIQTVISELSRLSSSAVEAMEHSVTRAHDGVTATNESGDILTKILASVQQISELNEQIAAATYEQSTTFNEVTGHMTDMHRNAEQVMESTHQLDTASKDIHDVSNGLQSVAGQFRV
ncbi:methyl-accepting chemotaxis protein [Marinobacter xestospongiae]|uniref:methyl-accepting chemotaxis protein n=1 Tax=Marinobacter xestospongiae TaxID=994319 RepID=UPI002002FD9F|nr:methyl-accepting chemotaxis protein [Marinobacter xestospongiae]MCK7568451.1 methyl-accepting chemotaxis protein [Marinobacter xestospongiae]